MNPGKKNTATDQPTAEVPDSSSESPEKPRISRVRWRSSPDYDDERLLVDLRRQYPTVAWSELTTIFNDMVPSNRARTVEAVANKGKVLFKTVGNLADGATAGSIPAYLQDNGVSWNQVSCEILPQFSQTHVARDTRCLSIRYQ